MRNDPRFPNRPDHPDFWRLSEIVMGMDAWLDVAKPENRQDVFQKIVTDVIDIRSVTYMADQRALRAMMFLGVPREYQAATAAMWLEAFIMGVKYARGLEEHG